MTDEAFEAEGREAHYQHQLTLRELSALVEMLKGRQFGKGSQNAWDDCMNGVTDAWRRLHEWERRSIARAVNASRDQLSDGLKRTIAHYRAMAPDLGRDAICILDDIEGLL